MRLAFFALAIAAVGCSVNADPSPSPPSSSPSTLPSTPPEDTTAAPAPKPSETADDDGMHREVVYVFMRDRFADLWYCTGTLVAPDRAVTAAHCLDTKQFVSYQVVAPLADGKPRVRASNPHAFGGSYEDVANPDIGWLTLDTPIDVPVYAELTDVVAQVEAGEEVMATAVVRTDEKPEAPFYVPDAMPVRSTVEYGYDHGFGTPMFSKGGDSGAGLFLVENGKVTHKLIGVARQPEPERDLDHFTRIDADFLAWFNPRP